MLVQRSFPLVEQQPDLGTLEEAVLRQWATEGTFAASVESRPLEQEFIFYDGPPFANGLPHYGHLLTGFVKDTIARYRTMRGKRVERRFGWDCHGLPAEMEAEKELALFGRAQVLEYGIDRFNEFCRQSVMRYTAEWERYVNRQARWVDFANDYKTMDLSYMESVMWAFATLYRKGLVYEGFRVLPYCWECETPLSNFETRLDDAYRDRVDPAVTVGFRLVAAPGEPETRLLVWTTTPWTLPSNLALAVNPDTRYAVFERDGIRLVLGASATERYEPELAGARRVGDIPGAELVGRRYQPLFPFFAGRDAFRVLPADFIEEGTGTGIVHMAPAFGEDDQRLCEEHGIGLVNPVDERGRFTAEVADYAGQLVFDANQSILADLRRLGLVERVEEYTHSYPHCWRSDTPLIYRAQSSWFVAVSKLADRLLELNQQINWVPAHIKDGAFGNWLEGARDWSLSRNRFWGSPIPVWVSDDPTYPRIDVYGSLDELERDFGVRLTDLHRPAIDQLTRPNPDDPTGQATMRRIPDVLDVWFDSGSMPFAQVHYPMENRDWFETHNPADFVVEYIGQTRGWFYTLHVIAAALFDRPAFASGVVHGVLLGQDGRKMSKRLRNFPEPGSMFDRHGADAMRWFLLSSPVLTGRELVVNEEGIEDAIRRLIRPLWNAWYFLALYARADNVTARWRTDAPGLLDRYILARARALVERVTAEMDAYGLAEACRAVEDFLDSLNNWYIRRSRDRFWGGGQDEDRADAYDTLFTVLEVVTRTVAPLLPLVSDAIYRGLAGDGSVHLAPWPDSGDLPEDAELVAGMDRARAVCSAALHVRLANKLRVRQPLARLTVADPEAEALRPFLPLIAAEVNVKEIVLTADVASQARQVLEVHPRLVGPRLGGAVQDVLAAARQGRWQRREDGTVEVAGSVLLPGEFDLRLQPVDAAGTTELPGRGLVVLDLEVTAELAEEGVVRDLIRLVQVARREAGLDIADHVELTLELPDDVARAARARRGVLAGSTLADDVVFSGPPAEGGNAELPDGRPVRIRLRRAG
ncbi:MAG: isoleucine--tRNA ligase [Acidimicrobiia bacterium]